MWWTDRPRLGLVKHGADEGIEVKARATAKAKPKAAVTSIRLYKDTHAALAIRAQLADMTMDQYLNWLMEQAPVNAEAVRRLLKITTRKDER